MISDTKFRALISPTDAEIAQQIRGLKGRVMPVHGARQVNFTAVEVLLSLAATRVVKGNGYGGANAHLAGTPIPELSVMFKRSPSSILLKMANLNRSRKNQGSSESEAADWFGQDPVRLDNVYERILEIARHSGVDANALPDFMPRGAPSL